MIMKFVIRFPFVICSNACSKRPWNPEFEARLWTEREMPMKSSQLVHISIVNINKPNFAAFVHIWIKWFASTGYFALHYSSYNKWYADSLFDNVGRSWNGTLTPLCLQWKTASEEFTCGHDVQAQALPSEHGQDIHIYTSISFWSLIIRFLLQVNDVLSHIFCKL